MANLILLVTFLGLALSFLGTIMLVFSLPASFKLLGPGAIYLGEAFCVGDEPDTPPLGNYAFFKLPVDLFIKRVITDKDPTIICALILLVLGIVLQGYGVWLSVTDC